jgi:hypothetical protein
LAVKSAQAPTNVPVLAALSWGKEAGARVSSVLPQPLSNVAVAPAMAEVATQSGRSFMGNVSEIKVYKAVKKLTQDGVQ